MNKQEHHRKAGPGRIHAQGNGVKTKKQKQAGAFARGLRNWINGLNLARMANKRTKQMARFV